MENLGIVPNGQRTEGLYIDQTLTEEAQELVQMARMGWIRLAGKRI